MNFGRNYSTEDLKKKQTSLPNSAAKYLCKSILESRSEEADTEYSRLNTALKYKYREEMLFPNLSLAQNFFVKRADVPNFINDRYKRLGIPEVDPHKLYKNILHYLECETTTKTYKGLFKFLGTQTKQTCKYDLTINVLYMALVETRAGVEL